jgi:hypothetical protein
MLPASGAKNSASGKKIPTTTALRDAGDDLDPDRTLRLGEAEPAVEHINPLVQRRGTPPSIVSAPRFS